MQSVGLHWIVIPCYNEADRLQADRFLTFLEEGPPDYRYVFVNDGSRDKTQAVLEELAARSEGRAQVLELPQNMGKAEAVRHGVLKSLEYEPWCVGYWDADLATPLELIPDMRAVLTEKPEVEVVLGSRVRLLGKAVERKMWRHYLGRVFASLVSLALKIPVYDTQCGAKLIRVTENTARVFEEPFMTTWLFDVEMLGRYQTLVDPLRAFYEHPLAAWKEIPGSKVRPADFVKAIGQLSRLYWLRLRHL